MRVSESPLRASGKGPYVGLRPFEKEERDLFFGRDRDARFVCDKVHSARLTLLYAQSGTGKTSLLRAIVQPQLEDEDMLVIAYDDWTNTHPLALLKEKICRVAESVGVVDADAGAPSILDLVRLTSAATGKTVALVLDQFEELLIAQSSDTDSIGKELGVLVRATDADARVLLALREDFLAALEPFRYEIVNLFQNTHRLRHLTHGAVRDAIVRPANARNFHGEYDAEVVETLIRDLTTERPASPVSRGEEEDESVHEAGSVGEEPPVDLPLLQLVCRELWERAGRKDGVRRIDWEVYDRAGGTEAIVDAYVRRVMPESWRDRRDTARVLQFLCPPSGLKMAYTVDDLVHHCDFPPGRVREVLKPLTESDILRVRQRGAVRYELRHDAFIRVLRPWMEGIQDQIRVRRRLQRVAVASLALLVLVGLPAATMVYQKRQSAHARTVGRLETLRSEPTSATRAELVFGDVFGFMVSADPLGKRDDDVAALLQEYEPELPADYGIYQSGIDHIRLPKNRGYWPLALDHAKDRLISRRHFQLHWNLLVKEFAARWGLPLPRGVRLKPNADLENDELILTSPDASDEAPSSEEYRVVRVELKAPGVEDLPYIDESMLTERGKSFAERFAVAKPGAWGPVPYLETGSHRSVPRWSLPVWKVTGGQAYDGAGALAAFVGSQILAHPALVLRPRVVDQLLENLAEIHPIVVREARAARGDRLPSDLVEIVKRGRSIGDLDQILDELASHSNGGSSAVAREVDLGVRAKTPLIAARARGPWKSVGAREKSNAASRQVEDPPALMGAFEQSFYWLFYERQLPIRIYFGADVEEEVMRNRRASQAIQDALSEARTSFTERYGVRFPLVKLYEHDALGSSSLAPNQFRIEVLSESPEDPSAAPVTVEAGAALQTILRTLERRANGFRVHWLRADEVDRLRKEQLSAPTRNWIDARYSVTDLKHLLRHVVASNSEDDLPPPSHTLAFLNWLLQSLVFWKEVDDERDLASLGKRLQQTQEARIVSGGQTPSSKSAPDFDEGLAHLAADDLRRASKAFGRAVRRDRDAAIATFLRKYPDNLESSIRTRYAVRCVLEDPTGNWWHRSPELSFEDQADFSSLAKRTEDTELRRSLRVCAFVSLADSKRALERGELLDAMLRDDPDFASWPPNEAAAVAKRILHEDDQNDPRFRDVSEELLVSAFGQWSLPEAEAVFGQLAENQCGAEGEAAASACDLLLERLVTARTDSETMSKLLAIRTSASEAHDR